MRLRVRVGVRMGVKVGVRRRQLDLEDVSSSQPGWHVDLVLVAVGAVDE